MIGNNNILLATFDVPDFLPNHPQRKEIMEFIVREYWKEWKNKLRYSHKPYLRVKGLGYFEIDFVKGRRRVKDLIPQMRKLKKKYPDKINNPETKMGAIYNQMKEEFSIIWKQLDVLKLKRQQEVIRWNKNYLKTNHPEKIKANYEWIFKGVDSNNMEGDS